MSGLFSAAFLRQVGWDCDVYERSSVELVGRGAGITTHPELLEALEKSGAGTNNLGIEVPKRIAIDRQGRITDERPLRQILTSWDRLQRLLRATIDPAHYHLGWAFERVEQFGMRGDAGAAADQFDARALVDVAIPADLAQECGAEQPRHRAADDDGAPRF